MSFLEYVFFFRPAMIVFYKGCILYTETYKIWEILPPQYEKVAKIHYDTAEFTWLRKETLSESDPTDYK